MIPTLPENAPFPPEQREWLNGFFAGLLGGAATPGGPPSSADPVADDGELPWHDPALLLPERQKLAEGKPIRLRLMAAMGQLDCGQCGYLCKTYAQAIATGAEKDLGRCVPGGKPTTKAVKKLMEEAPIQAVDVKAAAPASADAGPSRDRPVKVRMLSCERLNSRDSEKDTRAVVLDLGGTGLAYEPGDSLGVWPTNDPDLVEVILSILRAKGNRAVVLEGETLTAREALTGKVNLREPTAELFALMAESARLDFEAQRLAFLAEDDTRAAGYGIHDVFDALVKFRSARPALGAFVQSLARLQPRVYSISSSMKKHPGEVHLTVGVVRYDLNGRDYLGLGSGYFAEHLRAGRPVPVFVQKAHAFSLPANPETPIVMIGPGTGVAPFRAFLEERVATGARGRTWLFFGDQHAATDFLYREELEAYLASGALTRLSTAFSRDQAEKVYVQHRMLDQGEELWRWIAEGAHVYVCGDAARMAADVDHALAEVVATHGGFSKEDAAKHVKELAKAGRYQRDVY